jgi:predicted small secreted protein
VILFYSADIIFKIGYIMRHIIMMLILGVSCFSTACNTVGGLGQDLSETGKALDRAAFWSQNQIQEIDKEVTSSDTPETNNNNYGSSGLVVQEPDTLRQY